MHFPSAVSFPSASPFATMPAPHQTAVDIENRTGPSVIVIEDDIDTSERVCRELQAQGFHPVAAFSGEEGLSVLNSQSFGLVILDWILPGCSGLSVLKTLRACGNRVPVFLVSMLDALENRVLGLENGADDYLVKPFAFPELFARMRAQLRRTLSDPNLPRQVGDLLLHLESRRVLRAGQEAALTPREFDMLLYLVQRRGTVVTRDMFARDVWRVTFRTPSLDNAIDVHVAHLRRKIDAEHDVKLIHTVRGEGFMVAEKIPAPS